MSMLATSTNSNGILQRIGVSSSVIASAYNILTSNKAPATLNAPGSQDTLIQGLSRFEKDVDKSTIQSFDDIIDRLKGPLLIELRKSRKQFQPFAIRLLVVGKDEESAVPSIVVFCPDAVRELVKKFFQRETARRMCQASQPGLLDLELLVVGHPPRPKATSRGPGKSLDMVNIGNVRNSDSNNWSNSVKIEGAEGARYATMGGVLIVTFHDDTSSVYGLTAGHALVQDRMQPPGGVNCVVIEADTRTSKSTPSSSTTTKPIMDTIYWSTSGNIAEASYSDNARNRDWALIESFSQSVFSPTAEKFSVDVDLGDPISSVAIGSKPLVRGKVSSLPSVALLPFGLDFVRVHTITLQDGQDLLSGASGSWVVSEQNTNLNGAGAALQYLLPILGNHDDQKFRVHGHVVADDVLGDIYMVPLTDILSDIARELGAREVRLPKSREEMSSLLLRPSRTTLDRELETLSSLMAGIVLPLSSLSDTPDPEVQKPFKTADEINSRPVSTGEISKADRLRRTGTTGDAKFERSSSPTEENGSPSRTTLDPEVQRPFIAAEEVASGHFGTEETSRAERPRRRLTKRGAKAERVCSPMEETGSPPTSSRATLDPEGQKPSRTTGGNDSRLHSTEQLRTKEPRVTSFYPALSYTQDVGQVGEGKKSNFVLRWMCCACHGDNSYDTDVGCAYCSNHWRADCCELYGVPPLKS